MNKKQEIIKIFSDLSSFLKYKYSLMESLSLIENCSPTIIKGNYSEIYAMYESSHHSSGIDSDKTLTIESIKKASIYLSQKYACTVLASGKLHRRRGFGGMVR